MEASSLVFQRGQLVGCIATRWPNPKYAQPCPAGPSQTTFTYRYARIL